MSKLKTILDKLILKEMKNQGVLKEESSFIYVDQDSMSDIQTFFDDYGTIYGDELGVTGNDNIQHPEIGDWHKFWRETKDKGTPLINFGSDNYRQEDDFAYEYDGNIYWYDWSEGYMAVLPGKMKSKLMSYAKKYSLDDEDEW